MTLLWNYTGCPRRTPLQKTYCRAAPLPLYCVAVVSARVHVVNSMRYVKTLSSVMSCSEDFKGMLALANSRQSLNMSKHSEKHKFQRLYGNSKQSRQRRNTLLTHNGGRGPELSEEGRKETRHLGRLTWWRAPSKLLRVNLRISSTQTCKYQNLEKTPKKTQRQKPDVKCKRAPSASNLARPPARTQTHSHKDGMDSCKHVCPSSQTRSSQHRVGLSLGCSRS